MIDLVCKFSKAGGLVLNSCKSTFATSRECWQLLEHRKFAGRVKYFVCLKVALPSLVEVHKT